jgi:tripartite-type tricarboxylate transporter receptor subunit TctC
LHGARLLLAAIASLAATAASAQTAADFFRSHPVTIYIGYGPGGGYDLDCRLFATYLGRHLPGNPVVVARNQPGAGSLRLANELYNVLPKDGTALGMIAEVLVIDQVLGEPQAQFDAKKFNWIGRIVDSDPVLAVRPDKGFTSLKDATIKEAVIGVPGAGSAPVLTLTVLDNLLGTKFKLVSGYEGSAQIRLAVERNEVDGTGSSPWHLDKGWIRQQKLRVLYQTTLEPAADLPDVPTVVQLGRTDDERKILKFFMTYTVIGRSILAPPGVPADRLALLRAAFDATVADPGFVADAQKANLDLDVMGGEKLTPLIANAMSLGGPPLDQARHLAGR